MIEIGDNVSIAHGVSILSFDHGYADPALPFRDNPVILKKVTIGDNVWIGCGVRILKGVEIGSGSIVAAGAVVTRNVPPGVIVAGVPARVLHTLEQKAGG